MKTVSYNELSELTGVSYRTIKKRLAEAGIQPERITRQRANLFRSDAALRAIYAPMVDNQDEKLDPAHERAQLDRARREAQELKNEEARKHLAPVEVTGRIIAEIAINVRTKALGIPSKIAAIVPADIRVQVVKDADKLVREILSDLAAYVPEAGE